MARFSGGSDSAIKALLAGMANADREDAMMPGMSIVQWVEKRKMRGGRNPNKDETRMTRRLPNLSASIPPGSCRISRVKDCSVVRAPRMLVEPPSSRMYRLQNGRQRNMANIDMLWARVTAMRFLFDKRVRTDDLKDI